MPVSSSDGPHIPVRLNRSVMLQQVLAARRGYFPIITRPQQGEHSSHVMGLNKAATRGLQRHLLTWFREQSIVLEKMNRHQNSYYENLVRLQKQREVLGLRELKAREQRRLQEKQYKTTTKQVANGIMLDNSEASYELLTKDAEEGGEGTNVARIKEKKSQVPNPSDGVQTDNLLFSHNIYRNTSSPVIIKSKTSSLKKTKKPETDIYVKSARSLLEQNKLTRESTVVTSTDVAAFPETRLPKIAAQSRSLPHTAVQGHRNNVPPLLRTTTLPSITLRMKQCSKFEEGFTCYQKDRDGNIIPADIPYRRRKFLNPASKDPSIHEMMLRSEEMSRNSNRNKFSGLLKELEELEEWNPLDEIHHCFHQVDGSGPHLGGDTARLERYGNMSLSMRHMVQAFGGNYGHLLEGLDPDSREALMLCRYIRKPAE